MVPQESYVEVLLSKVTIFGNKAFEEMEKKLNEVREWGASMVAHSSSSSLW
jgi:hypothetical protein